MASPIIIATTIESGVGFLLTSTVLYLVLSHARKTYHYLFAAFLAVCVLWDFGTFLLMIRNDHPAELPAIGAIIWLPCSFIPILVFHFVILYTGRRMRWAIWMGWAITTVMVMLTLAGVSGRIRGIYAYDWGNVFKVDMKPSDYAGLLLFWFAIMLWSCSMLFQAARRASSALERRHFRYLGFGFLVTTFSVLKAGVVMGINFPVLLPLGMFLNDVFVAIMGLAIIKDRLFDITVIFKKGALYSLLAGLFIFAYSFCEHLLITYVAEFFGEYSNLAHFVSLAIGIAVLIPVKSRIEHGIEGYFGHRTLQF